MGLLPLDRWLDRARSGLFEANPLPPELDRVNDRDEPLFFVDSLPREERCDFRLSLPDRLEDLLEAFNNGSI